MRRIALSLVLVLLVLSAPAGAAGGGTPPRPPAPPAAVAFDGRPTVGALLLFGGLGPHFCTATVVESRQRNVLLTAAHCMYENEVGAPRRDVAFVPHYRDGLRPHGTWRVQRVVVSPRWPADPDHDVAFLVVEPKDGRQIADVVGANRVAFGDRREQVVDVPGYPMWTPRPVTCRNWTVDFSPTQRGFDCRGYLEGTSGGPWLTDRGEIVGVVGGFQYGGDMILHNYSPRFTEQTRRLLEQAGG
ncbi:trypsin-like serine peptidase [Amycolatopsis suaedae]|uniref:Trypsin-like serine protease n=1 Tax=Amycolatopsis suaedae TaxID=2510978 RepID=A0A4Q7JEX0_9PSEU|nr:trypsin-like peptidase domain-containing protein [Amycolatopsis suaedae]RZQ65878.1 trypsin-like serine protease [Amycolatopsis suaedae]